MRLRSGREVHLCVYATARARCGPDNVIADTATAVSSRVSRRQPDRWYSEDQQVNDEPGPAPAAAAPDPIEQLRPLGELHASGLLTDAEFEAQKAKILG